MTSSKSEGKYWNLNLEPKYICWVLFAIYFTSLTKMFFLICIISRINVHKVIYKTILLCEHFSSDLNNISDRSEHDTPKSQKKTMPKILNSNLTFF